MAPSGHGGAKNEEKNVEKGRHKRLSINENEPGNRLRGKMWKTARHIHGAGGKKWKGGGRQGKLTESVAKNDEITHHRVCHSDAGGIR